MFEFIREHQMTIMTGLSAVCLTMALLLLVTRFLSERRKWILILMELIATFLLWFDRAAYIYKGDTSSIGYVMVRVSNFMVFFLTSAVVLGFNLYLIDLLSKEARVKRIPRRLKAVNYGALAGMGLVILSQFTGLYYTIDADNVYHRGPGFLICYLVPVVFPIIQYTVIRRYRKAFSKLIYISLILYIFVPIAVGIIQIFTYGISIVNMSMVLVSIFLYVFNYLDINNEVEKAHELEVNALQKSQKSMKRLFDQTVTAFVTAIEKRDAYSEGHSVRVAEYARRIARKAGKKEQECEEVYYAALLHDVGMVGIPDAVIQKADGFTEEELQQKRQKPVLSAEILSSITEYPYLSEGARYSRERYDGSGYPEGLAGEEIPEISRIINIADAYDTMIRGKRSRAPLSYQVAREEFIKQSGTQFDPNYTEIMVQIMDEELAQQKQVEQEQHEKELVCGVYRDRVTSGIRVEKEVIRIRFQCERNTDDEAAFSAPSIILYDSYDMHVHNDAKTIEAYHYLEYGEVWFDGHYVATNARETDVQVRHNPKETDTYEITVSRYEDHLALHMISPKRIVDVIMALPDSSKASYIGLTGENCYIRNIRAEKTGEKVKAGTIRQIVNKISYIERLESDLPNVQIDHTRSDATPGFLLQSESFVEFHTMSLPSANLVWHCPYIVLFYSDDQRVGGKGYREFALIKLNGESSGDTRDAENQFVMRRNEQFPGWDEWKRINKVGLECTVRFLRRGARVMLFSENLGISIENTMTLHDKTLPVYAALTGDQVALTDIRVR